MGCAKKQKDFRDPLDPMRKAEIGEFGPSRLIPDKITRKGGITHAPRPAIDTRAPLPEAGVSIGGRTIRRAGHAVERCSSPGGAAGWEDRSILCHQRCSVDDVSQDRRQETVHVELRYLF